jgi:hypothetical protein
MSGRVLVWLCRKAEVTSAAVARTRSLAVANSNLMNMHNPLKSAICSAFIKRLGV